MNNSLLLVALLVAQVAGAQGTLSPACSIAVSTLVAGSLAAPDSQIDALAVIDDCGTTGDSAVAIAMRRRRLEPISASTHMAFIRGVGDTARLNAALDLATDASAGV